MNGNGNKRKVKGGAEKERQKKKKRFEEQVKKCQNLKKFYGAKNSGELEPDPEPKLNHENEEFEEKVSLPNVDLDSESDSECFPLAESCTITTQSEPEDPKAQKPFNPFEKPSQNNLKYFFSQHPKISENLKNLPFKHTKVFIQDNGSERAWISYSDEKSALFCTVCLAFSLSNFAFETGVSDWKHI